MNTHRSAPRLLSLAAIGTLGLALCACGVTTTDLGNVGGLSTNSGVAGAIAQGIFRDSNVAGLSYSSPNASNASGVTASDGTFKYVVGTSTTFQVGSVFLGVAPGHSVVTPLDLVTSGSASNTQVLNIARFLMYLDQDGDPDNGISISDNVRTLAAGWPPIDFTLPADSFDSSLATTTVPSDLTSITGETHKLPTSDVAHAHLKKMLLCTYEGAFGGSYTGADDSGVIAVYLDPTTGIPGGYTYSTSQGGARQLTSDTPIDFDVFLPLVVLNDIGQNRTFNFQFSGIDNIAGHWASDSNGADTNTLAATRYGGNQNLGIRFAGSYSTSNGSDAGVMAFNVDTLQQDNISISGELYSVVANTNLLFTGTLTAQGTTSYQLTAQSSDNSGFSGFSGTINASTLSFAGTITRSVDPSQPGTIVGSFSGSGCGL